MLDLLDLNSQFNNLKKIEDKLFEVKKLQYPSPQIGFDAPESYGIYKNSGDWLGTVGNVYQPLQPKHFFDAVVNSLSNHSEIDLSKMKYNEYKGGRKISFRVPLKEISFKNKAKLNDVTEVYLDFMTTFDGSGTTNVGLYSKRLVCLNGMTINVANAQIRKKHTFNKNAEVLTFTHEIGKLAQSVDNFKLFATALNSIEMTQAKIDDALTKITGYNLKDFKSLSTRKQNIVNSINDCIAIEFNDTGATAFGLLNAITRYNTHIAPSSGRDSEEYVLFDSGAKMNEKAQKYLETII